MLLCEQNFRDVWSQNESVRAEIGQILHTHTAKLVVEMIGYSVCMFDFKSNKQYVLVITRPAIAQIQVQCDRS